jgi:CRP/FNR family transcriptional regulator
MAIDSETLRAIPYFAELSPASLRALASRGSERIYARGETILLEGDPCRGLYFVAAGRVKVFKLSPDGKEQVLRILGAGRTFNDVPVFDGGPNPGSVSAMDDCRIGFIPKPTILSLIDSQPPVAKAVIRVLAGRLRAMTTVVEDLVFRTVVARVAKLLLDCVQGEPTLMEGDGACTRLTQQQIAAMTGSVREVVQRALKIFERDGAIRMQRARIQILDPERLARWTESVATAAPSPPRPTSQTARSIPRSVSPGGQKR